MPWKSIQVQKKIIKNFSKYHKDFQSLLIIVKIRFENLKNLLKLQKND